MSNTTRSFRTGKGRDGKQDWTTMVTRDSRATGLRDHRRDRRITKVSLKTGEDIALSGKHRRYSNRYGEYLL